MINGAQARGPAPTPPPRYPFECNVVTIARRGKWISPAPHTTEVRYPDGLHLFLLRVEFYHPCGGLFSAARSPNLRPLLGDSGTLRLDPRGGGVVISLARCSKGPRLVLHHPANHAHGVVPVSAGVRPDGHGPSDGPDAGLVDLCAPRRRGHRRVIFRSCRIQCDLALFSLHARRRLGCRCHLRVFPEGSVIKALHGRRGLGLIDLCHYFRPYRPPVPPVPRFLAELR